MTTILFNDTSMLEQLGLLSDDALDQLHFGVIGFDENCMVRRFNRVEQTWSGIMPVNVLGTHVFERLAPCLNHAMVAQRYSDSATTNEKLDEKIEHVLTMRMRLTPSTLRLLSTPGAALRYLLIQRHA